MKQYQVYILRCADGSYYVGVTNNLKRRLAEHRSEINEGSYVSKRLPFTLVYSRSFRWILDAIAWEKRIKRWTRAKKEALITRDKERLRFGARGQCRRRIDHMRSITRVTLRRTQGDTDESHAKSIECHGESVEP